MCGKPRNAGCLFCAAFGSMIKWARRCGRYPSDELPVYFEGVFSFGDWFSCEVVHAAEFGRDTWARGSRPCARPRLRSFGPCVSVMHRRGFCANYRVHALLTPGVVWWRGLAPGRFTGAPLHHTKPGFVGLPVVQHKTVVENK